MSPFASEAPGNDGPVSQSNVAVAVSAGPGGARSTTSGNAASTGSAPAAGVPVGFPGASALPGFVSLPAVLSPVVSVPSMAEAGGLSGLVAEPGLPWMEGFGFVELPTASPILGRRAARPARPRFRVRTAPRRRAPHRVAAAGAQPPGTRQARPRRAGAPPRPRRRGCRGAGGDARSQARESGSPLAHQGARVTRARDRTVRHERRARVRRRLFERWAPHFPCSSVPGRAARSGQACRDRPDRHALRASQPHTRYAWVALLPSRRCRGAPAPRNLFTEGATIDETHCHTPRGAHARAVVRRRAGRCRGGSGRR